MSRKPCFLMPNNRQLVRPQNRARVAPLAGRRFEVKNDAADPDTTELYLYDEIGYWGITANDIAAALAPIKTANIRVRVNSGGGDVWDGVAIYNLFANHPAEVEMCIDSIAASIASVICMAGDKVTVAKNGAMMIHRASGICMGTADDMTAMADILTFHENAMIIPAYAAKTGMKADDILALMKAETWMDAQACVDKGFADRMSGDSEATALLRPGLYANVPERFRAADGDWKCAADMGLEIDETDTWDGSKAAEAILDHAGFNGSTPDSTKARPYFFAYDAGAPTKKESYKLPFADFVGGKLKAIEGGLRAVASRLPNTDIPESLKNEIRSKLDTYFKRRDDEKEKSNRLATMRNRLRLAKVSG
ncbi:MAG TPA: head maturation protease, ClpP-related [Rhizomicrobium sp.]|jgi:ATP-dependent protease ClpP protease subunit|nr:head maturation protease, ClpP-related [Rhizomicrobium sp.]